MEPRFLFKSELSASAQEAKLIGDFFTIGNARKLFGAFTIFKLLYVRSCDRREIEIVRKMEMGSRDVD